MSLKSSHFKDGSLIRAAVGVEMVGVPEEPELEGDLEGLWTPEEVHGSGVQRDMEARRGLAEWCEDLWMEA